jgi:drug/metabolite transporter (DMT)-like permease
LTEALAVLAAVTFGGSHVSARLGLRDTGFVAGVLIANGTAAVILIVATLIDPPGSVPMGAMRWFALSGLVGGPGLASAAILLGIRRLGPPTHVPLQGGSYGIVVSIGAALFLSEAVGATKAAGIALIVVGAGWLVRAQAKALDPRVEEAVPVGETGGELLRSPEPKRLRSILKGWYLPLAAGALLATSDLIAKWELRAFPHAMFAAAVAMTFGTLVWAAAGVGVPAFKDHLRLGRHWRWFIVSGITVGIAYAALNNALNRGDASTVGPIVSTEPLAAILLSALFLQALHRVTGRMILAGCLVVAGTVLVSI